MLFVALQFTCLFTQLLSHVEMAKKKFFLSFFDTLFSAATTLMNRANSLILDCVICLYFKVQEVFFNAHFNPDGSVCQWQIIALSYSYSYFHSQ